MSEIKPRTDYLLKRTDRPDDGTGLYVGSTSKNLKERLWNHKSETQRKRKVNKSKLYTRMLEVGVNNWEIVPLLSFSCDKKTILEFEREWCNLLTADLNSNLAILNPGEKEKYKAKYRESNRETIHQKVMELYHSNIQNKVYHCNACNKSFGQKIDLKRHLDTLKHQCTYLNSLD